MTTTYLPPVTFSSFGIDRSVAEPITEGPAYIRTRSMSRWHRIRSGIRWIAEWDPNTINTSYGAWCGQSMGTRRTGTPWLTDTPPAGEPLCGTCEGRAIGANPERPEWLFEPRELARPKNCPGSRTERVRMDQGVYNYGTCLYCGLVVHMRSSGSPYNPTWGAVTHPPAPGFPDPCPIHAWSQLIITNIGPKGCRCGVAS